jgi:hypothetical protein
MTKSLRYSAHYLEAVFLTEADSALVCSDHEVMLHRLKASIHGLARQVLTHHRCDTPPTTILCNNIAALADVITMSRLLGLEVLLKLYSQ